MTKDDADFAAARIVLEMTKYVGVLMEASASFETHVAAQTELCKAISSALTTKEASE